MDWSFDEVTLQRAANHPVLSKAVERTYLIRAIRDGDEDARAFIVEHNIRLVIKRVRRFSEPSDARYHDLISAGFVGLMRALSDFDLDRTVKDTGRFIAFSTYAVWWIDAEIRKELEYLQPKPIRNRSLVTKYRTAAYRLARDLKYYPNDNVVFEHLDWDEETIQRYHQARESRLVTLDSEFSEGFVQVSRDTACGLHQGGPQTLAEVMSAREHRHLLDRALRLIPPEAEDIIRRHYGCGYPCSETYEDLALFYHRTRERVRQIENEGLRLLWVLLESIDPNQ